MPLFVLSDSSYFKFLVPPKEQLRSGMLMDQEEEEKEEDQDEMKRTEVLDGLSERSRSTD